MGTLLALSGITNIVCALYIAQLINQRHMLDEELGRHDCAAIRRYKEK